MSHTILPTANDLDVLLLGAGMISAPKTDAQSLAMYGSAITATAQEWGVVTGYQPFLADTVDVLRTFDPPGPPIRGARYGYRARGGERFLDFDNGLVSLTSMTTGVDSVSTGTVRTLNTDFYLYPSNAVAEGRPFMRAEFVMPVWGSQQSVHVLGKWGYAAAIPDDAWMAMLFMAAARLTPGLLAAKFGGVTQIKLGDDSWSFPVSPWKATTDEWKAQLTQSKMDYLRL